MGSNTTINNSSHHKNSNSINSVLGMLRLEREERYVAATKRIELTRQSLLYDNDDSTTATTTMIPTKTFITRNATMSAALDGTIGTSTLISATAAASASIHIFPN